MSLYASNIVSFDIGPPLRCAGADCKRQAWEGAFAAYTGPIAYEVRDLNVTTDGDLAFVHSVNHVKGTLASGHTTELGVRWTGCFRRINGDWRIVHDYVSIPADLEHGQAVLNLTPGHRGRGAESSGAIQLMAADSTFRISAPVPAAALVREHRI